MRAKLAWALVMMAVVLSLAGAPAAAEDPTPTVISEIRQESTDRSTRLIVDCSGPMAYTYYSPDPLTLVVDIPEIDASKVPSRINVGTREIESVRVTQMARADGRNLARLEVRLASLVPYQIYSKDKRLNLVFERSGAATAQAKPAEPADKPTPKATEAKVAETAAEPTSPAPAAAPEASSVPAAPPAPEPVKAPAPSKKTPAPRASRILGVSQGHEGGQLALTVRADGSLRYQDFFLGNPDRLVVDFPEVVTQASVRPLEVNQPPVKKVRIAQFSSATPKVARLVLDLSARAPYRIVEGSDGVKILFGEGQMPKPTPLAALRTEPAAAAPAPAPAPVPVEILQPLPKPAPAVAPMPEAPGAPRAGEEAATGKQFTGQPISLDFKEGDILDIFRLFGDISGLNVVVNPGVTGKVTLKLNEVPWDQALDLILKTNGLGYTREDNVIRIAPLATLQKEEADRRKLQDEKALAGDLVPYNKTLSYAKAEDLEPTLKKVALSARGNITLDKRTNTMLITDLAAYIDKARLLIEQLDVATKQVEIEARIVVTSRNFTRDLGIQWGFNQERSPRFGNTTDRAFPNSMIINGTGVPSGSGISADQNGQASNSTVGIGRSGRGYAVNLPASGFNSAIGISMGNILGNFSLDAALTALERQGRGRILSTPKITTQNNQQAEIKQGTQIPIQTVANNTVTVTFKDAVLTLKVTPQITDAGTVILAVVVENNTPDFANLVGGIPPINTQSANTNVLVRDGATAVIGGIYQSNEQTAQQSTPFLGHIPLLGYLFRNRFVQTNNNELLLFITPRIIKG